MPLTGYAVFVNTCLYCNPSLHYYMHIPYPKCPPLQLISARIPCGHLTDVHAEYWNTMSATSARRPKKISEKERGRPLEFLSDNFEDAADICWTFCSNTPHPLEFYADVR